MKYARKLNLFEENVVDESPSTVFRGLIKTGIFGVAVLISLSVILSLYSRPSSIVLTIDNPTPSQYSSVLASNPTISCACTVPSVSTASIATMYLRLAGWCDRPEGSSLLDSYKKFCTLYPDTVAPNGNRLCPANAGLSSVIDQFCAYYHHSLSALLADWNSSSIFTPTLLPASDLQASFTVQLTAFVSRLALNFRISFELIGLYELYARPLTGFGYSASPILVTGINDANAASGYSYTDGTSIRMGNAKALEFGSPQSGLYIDATGASARSPQVVFVPTRKGNFGFDTRVNNWGGGYCEGDYNSTANIACSGFTYYLTTSFNKPNGESYFDELPQLPVSYFKMKGSLSDAATTGLIDESSVMTLWAEYFSKCAPASCSYSETRRPTSIELFTVVLGVLGGISGILYSAINQVVDAAIKALSKLGCIKKKPLAVMNPSDSVTEAAPGNSAGADASSGAVTHNPIYASERQDTGSSDTGRVAFSPSVPRSNGQPR